MNQRLEYGQPGFSWVLRMVGWVALLGTLLVVAPMALVLGQVAATWAAGVLACVLVTYAWLGSEAVAVWHGPSDAEPHSGSVPSES